MKKVMIAIATVALCSASFGGTENAAKSISLQEAAEAQASAAQAAAHSAQATSPCAFTFTSGTDNTFLQYCVTANGNIAQLATPFAREHIAVGSIGEGYGICDTTTSTAYFDYADFGDSENWGSATVVSQDQRTVKIARSTSDGAWTLTQTITRPEGTQSVKVTMALRNNTSNDRLAFLIRYADLDVSGTFSNNFDATAASAFGWNSFGSSTPPFGLMVQNVGNTNGLRGIPFAQNVGEPPNPCVPGSHLIFGPTTGTDGSIVMSYDGTVPKNRTRTVTLNYKGM
jgi:hypothetical protein